LVNEVRAVNGKVALLSTRLGLMQWSNKIDLIWQIARKNRTRQNARKNRTNASAMAHHPTQYTSINGIVTRIPVVTPPDVHSMHQQLVGEDIVSDEASENCYIAVDPALQNVVHGKYFRK